MPKITQLTKEEAIEIKTTCLECGRILSKYTSIDAHAKCIVRDCKCGARNTIPYVE